MRSFIWDCGPRRIEIGPRPLVMGVVNVTPDSFSDGGRFLDPGAAVEHARRLLAEGADLLDLGGESTRPGSQPVPADEQSRRLLPVLAAIRAGSDVPISIDTTSAVVAERCLDAGADIVNDISGLRADPAMPGVVRDHRAGAVVMHMLGTPATMQIDPRYDDVVAELAGFFARRIDALVAAGISVEQIALDPGIGFGKTTTHNLTLLAHLDDFRRFGRPLCLGVSRKRFVGELTGSPVADRGPGSLAAACPGMAGGTVQIVRTHDVKPTRDAAEVCGAIARHRICR